MMDQHFGDSLIAARRDAPLCPECGVNKVGHWRVEGGVKYDPTCTDCGYDPIAEDKGALEIGFGPYPERSSNTDGG